MSRGLGDVYKRQVSIKSSSGREGKEGFSTVGRGIGTIGKDFP